MAPNCTAIAKSALIPIDNNFRPLRLGDFRGQREMRRRRLLDRRNAHQAGNLQPIVLAAGAQKSVGIFRQHAGLLRFGAGIDFGEQQADAGSAARSPWPKPRTGLAGRRCGSRRTAPPPPWPCWIAAGRSDAARCPGVRLSAPAISPSPPAPGFRRTLSARPRSPARSPPAPKVFDTAIKVTGWEAPALLRASSNSARTFASRDA